MCSFSMLLSLGCTFKGDVGVHGTAGVICLSLLGGSNWSRGLDPLVALTPALQFA